MLSLFNKMRGISTPRPASDVVKDHFNDVCMQGCLDKIRDLLPHINKAEYKLILHALCQSDDIPHPEKTIELLLNSGFDINERDHKNENAFFWLVARNGSVDLARFLIAKGSEVNIQDPNGITPLHLAIEFCNIPMVTLLVNEGKADLDLKEYRTNSSPLMVVRQRIELLSENKIYQDMLTIFENRQRLESAPSQPKQKHKQKALRVQPHRKVKSL